jgi:hypothetical protein
MATGEKYSTVSRESLLETENGWILEFVIINREGKDTNYAINVFVDGKLYTDKILIVDGGAYTYIYHIYRAKLTEGEVSVTIYKEGEDTPFEQMTYYLKKPE